LFICSILWDLNIPQEVATVAYKDNDGCTSMGIAQKPTPCTHHIDIKYFALCDWIERDLLILEQIIPQLTHRTTSQKRFCASSSIVTPISFLDMFLHSIRQYTDKLLPHTAASTKISIRLSRNRSPLPLPLVLHGLMPQFLNIFRIIRGYQLFGMMIQFTITLWIVGGC
jgi:hypothetical protein